MAKTSVKKIKTWQNFHLNGPWDSQYLLETQLENKQMMPDPLARYRDAAQEIQNLLQQALDAGEGFRALGSKWSLSNIAHHKERMHINQKMNLKIPITAQHMHPDSGFVPENLLFLQCGNVIKEISEYLFKQGKSLKTTGASNGQTIAGAISTGAHGSTIDVGSIPDCVVGLSLIVGPNPNDLVYLERSSQPALNDTFAAQLHTRIIRNDELFNAALVGLGSFGFIHGVVIEAEDCYLLQRYVVEIDSKTALHIADTMDFSALATLLPAESAQIRPRHYYMYVNPYREKDPYIVEIWYKKTFHNQYPNPIPLVSESLYLGLLDCFYKIIKTQNWLIPTMIDILKNNIFPKPNENILAPLKDLCWDAVQQGRAFGCSVGIDHTNTSRALRALIDLVKRKGPVPGIFGLRFVKASAATLAPSKFPFTCMLEIDGSGWDGSKSQISPPHFYKLFIETLQANQIPFTLHWGKNAAWDFPGLLEHMYGTEVPQTWKTYRSALLGPDMAQVFTNDFLKTIGLADYIGDVPPDLLV